LFGALAWTSSLAAMTGTFLAVAYLVALAMASGWATWQARDFSLLPGLPLALITIHAGAAWGVIDEFLIGTRTKATFANQTQGT
jgi:hypothetical protein